MKKMLQTGLLSLSLLIFGFAKGQNFTISDTVVEISNVTNNGPAHWYTEISNTTNAPLTIIWEATQTQGPGNWEFSLAPPDGQLYNIAVVDSSSFSLSANSPYPEKVLLSAAPNGSPGYGKAVIVFYQEQYPNQSVSVTFYVTIAPNPMNVEEVHKTTVKIWQTPSRVVWKALLPYRVYDLTGRLLDKGTRNFIPITELSAGIYLLVLNQDGHFITHKFVKP